MPTPQERWLWLLENKPPERGESKRVHSSPVDSRPLQLDVDGLRRMCEEEGLMTDGVDLLLRDLDHRDGSGGVDIGYRGPRDVTVDLADGVNERLVRLCCCTPKMSSEECERKVREIMDWLKESALADARMGRVLGPFKKNEIPFEHYRISPRFAVPKPGGAKYRPIHHLSYPRKARGKGLLGVNQYVTRLWTEELSCVEDVIADVLLVASTGGTPRIALSDVSGAFRQIPVRREDWCLLGYRCGDDYFFETVLCFGLSSAMEIFCKTANLVRDVIRAKAKHSLCSKQPTVTVRGRARYDDPWWKEKGRKVYKGVHTYVDDNQLITTSDRIHSLAEVNSQVMDRAGLPVCPKKALEGAPGKLTQRVLGKDINCEKMTVSTPPDKRAAILEQALAFNTAYRTQRRRPRQQELFKLVGKFQSVSRGVTGAEAFLQEMHRVSHSVTELHHHVRLTEAFWMEFDFFVLLLTRHNGVSLMHKYQDRDPRWFFATDASGFGVGPQLTKPLGSFPRYLPAKLRPSGTNLPLRGHSEWQFWPKLYAKALRELKRYTTRHPDLDGFACAGNNLCSKFFTERQNALLRDISGWFVWANPPYHMWPTVAAWLLDASSRDGRTGAMFPIPDYAMDACPELVAASVELLHLPAGSPGFIKHHMGRPLFGTPAPLRWDVSVRALLPWDDSLTAAGQRAIVSTVQARAGGYGGWMANAATRELHYFEGKWPVEAAGLPIHVLENVAYWVAVQKWSRLWGDDHVLMGNDNQAVLAVASRHRAKNPTLRCYGQAAALLEGQAGFTMDKGYVSSKNNHYADGLSRGDWRSIVSELEHLGYSVTRDDVTDLIHANISISNDLRADQRRERSLRAGVGAKHAARGQPPGTGPAPRGVCSAVVVQPPGLGGGAMDLLTAHDDANASSSYRASHSSHLRNGFESVAAILRLVLPPGGSRQDCIVGG